jgi:hypothetical protein
MKETVESEIREDDVTSAGSGVRSLIFWGPLLSEQYMYRCILKSAPGDRE